MATMVSLDDTGSLVIRKPAFNHLVKARLLAKAIAGLEIHDKTANVAHDVETGLAILIETYQVESEDGSTQE